MLHIIVADNKSFRVARLGEIISLFQESEIIPVDDTELSLLDLEQFLYPSLFSFEVPIIHGRFILGTNGIEEVFAKKLVTSPTVFIFEELALPPAILTTLKKTGATIHVGEKTKSNKPADDIFAATACITARDKKARWLAYRGAVEKQPIEAILGILYWKVRTLAGKEGKEGTYKLLYQKLLEAQAISWRTGAPLEALIEKVILTH